MAYIFDQTLFSLDLENAVTYSVTYYRKLFATNDTWLYHLLYVTYKINTGHHWKRIKNLLGSVFQCKEEQHVQTCCITASLVVQAHGMLMNITIAATLSKMNVLTTNNKLFSFQQLCPLYIVTLVWVIVYCFWSHVP